jgi:hypothetical protein
MYRLFDSLYEEAGHAQWVFVKPKMLRPYFLHYRELVGGLSRAAWETVRELMCAAMGAPRRDVPGTALCWDDHSAPRRASHNADAGHSANISPGFVLRYAGETCLVRWKPCANVDETPAPEWVH